MKDIENRKVIEDYIQRISALRTQKNLSARKLSEAIGKNYGYINKMEHEKGYLPTLDTMLAIFEACDTTPAEFFYDNPKHYKLDKEIINLLSTLDEESKRAVITILNKLKK